MYTAVRTLIKKKITLKRASRFLAATENELQYICMYIVLHLHVLLYDYSIKHDPSLKAPSRKRINETSFKASGFTKTIRDDAAE
jgi:hypothetical protein